MTPFCDDALRLQIWFNPRQIHVESIGEFPFKNSMRLLPDQEHVDMSECVLGQQS